MRVRPAVSALELRAIGSVVRMTPLASPTAIAPRRKGPPDRPTRPIRRSMAALISERWNAKGLWNGGRTLTKIGVLSAYAAPRTHRHVARSELPRADSRCDLHAYPSPSRPPAGSAIGGNPGVAGPMRIPPTSQLQTLGSGGGHVPTVGSVRASDPGPVQTLDDL